MQLNCVLKSRIKTCEMELNCSSDGLMAVLQTVMELATEITQSKLSSWFP